MKRPLGRNDQCWCGSGKKYKRCHLGRESEARPPISDGIRAFHDVQNRRVCLHADASPGTCQGEIVKAHTVQNALLRLIAKDNHVYGIPTSYAAIVSAGGTIRPQLMGIGKASTFTGFCAAHDDRLFADIEKTPITACDRHACLLAYRATCRELYAKEGGALLDPHFRTVDSGLSVPLQVALQAANTARMAGLSTGLNEIRQRKEQYDRILRSGDYAAIRYCVIWFNSPPDVMCCGAKNPDYDFAGDSIQDLADLTTPAQGITLALLASGELGCAYFSWLANEGCASEKLLASLLALPRTHIPDALVRHVWSTQENQFWRPDWWEGLAPALRDALLRRLFTAVHPLTPIPPDYLRDDGHRYVSWRVTSIETNEPRLAAAATASA